MSLALSNFDQTGHDPDALALFAAASSDVLYQDSDAGGSSVPIAGDMGLGGSETVIAFVRVVDQSSGRRRLAVGDRDNPSALNIHTYFGGNGQSHLTLHIQTDDGEVSSNQVQSGGGNIVRLQFESADNAVLDGISSGDRVIIAVTRATKPVAAQIAAAAAAVTAAVTKSSPANRPVAAQIVGAPATVAAAVRSVQPAQDPSIAAAVSATGVEAGQSVEIRWAASDALRVVIAALPGPDLGEFPPSGSIRVSPEVSTTWTLTAHGAAGTTPAVAAVTVAVTAREERSLLPPNATDLERAMEAAIRRPIDLPIRKLWSATECPVDLLPYLAWALSVEEWDPDWPEPVKRAAVAGAVRTHREKGTLAGLKRVLMGAGAEYEYTERPAGVPMTAKLSIFNSNAVYLPDAARAINRVKRLSLDLDIELSSAAAGSIPLAAGLGAATVVEISDWGPYAV